jgi:hypothetical protein
MAVLSQPVLQHQSHPALQHLRLHNLYSNRSMLQR